MTPNFATTLLELQRPEAGRRGETRYRVRQVHDTGHYIGRDSSGYPALLLNSRDLGLRTPIRLALLEVQFSLSCRITDDAGKETTETLTAISCRSHDDALTEYFAHVTEAIVRILGRAPTSQQVSETVSRLAELFQNLTRPAGRTVIGLFGELIVIHLSQSPKIALQAWRSSVDNRFDFAIDDARLETKAASDRIRAHHFSREQCMPPDGTRGVLVSLFVERSGGGLSVGELVERIEEQLEGDAELTLKLHLNVAETLGNATTEGLTVRFDEHLARGSLQIYDLNQIPAPRDDVPPEVSQVRFRADLSRLHPLATFPAGRVRELLPSDG